MHHRDGGPNPTELEQSAQPVFHRPTGACQPANIIPPSDSYASPQREGERPNLTNQAHRRKEDIMTRKTRTVPIAEEPTTTAVPVRHY